MSLSLQPKKGIVYHCMPVKAEGDSIRTSLNYGSEITPAMRERLGLISDEKPPLVFASAYLGKALAFGLQGALQEKILNCGIKGSDGGEMVLACDREKLLGRRRDITVYEISDQEFAAFPENDQCVRATPVPFSETKTLLRAQSAEDLMRAGLQIVSFKEPFPEAQKIFNDAMGDKWDLNGFLRDKVRDGTLMWENAVSGINPDPGLAATLGVSLPERKSAPAAQKPKPPAI